MLRCIVLSLIALFTLPASAQYNIKKLMEEGRRTLDMGYYVASMQIFTRIVALKPNLYEAWYLLALSKYHLEDFHGAHEDCKAALALQPYIADIFELYGMTCIREEKFDSAIVAYTKALEINPGNKDFWYNRAYSYFMSSNREESLKQINHILDRWPSFKEALSLREEIKSGRKAQRKLHPPSQVDLLKLKTLNRSTWLMKRMPLEKTKDNGKPKTDNQNLF